jgi:hypothetical protein
VVVVLVEVVELVAVVAVVAVVGRESPRKSVSLATPMAIRATPRTAVATFCHGFSSGMSLGKRTVPTIAARTKRAPSTITAMSGSSMVPPPVSKAIVIKARVTLGVTQPAPRARSWLYVLGLAAGAGGCDSGYFPDDRIISFRTLSTFLAPDAHLYSHDAEDTIPQM